MLRKFTCLAVFGVCALASVCGRAQTPALLVVGDAKQLSEVQLAKVLADDSSLWLSVRLQGRTRLALVTAGAAVESAPAAHAWLSALDFATRVRVAAPPGSACAGSTQFAPADTGLPEARRVAAHDVFEVASELELRRRLADAELPVDLERIARFTSRAEPPFQVLVYDLPELASSTEALRLVDHGHANELPKIVLSGADSLPLSLIALAKDGAQPFPEPSAELSEFPVSYRALDASSDYRAARRGWLEQNPQRWLNEVQASLALFRVTNLPSGADIDSATTRYLAGLSGEDASACQARVRAAHTRGSVNADDFRCGGADDLSKSLTELDFAEPRLSRFFGALNPDGATFRVAESAASGPLLVATDFDSSECAPELALPPTSSATGEPTQTRTPPENTTPVVVGTSSEATPVTTTATVSETSCTASSSSSSASGSDSCSGDSSSSESSSDSCSGDSSSSDSEDESCSGDSSSSDSEDDSCGGDSSDSNSDTCSGDSDPEGDSGCGKSGYDGDTCSGNSASSNSARAKSAALGAEHTLKQPRSRTRPVRLSLLTWLAAALALPLRRLRAWR
ncbi:MAG TPA: hypothetical protein VFK05_16150 [Polyangiaceae bacterium]|nr:hypothetical protein [Polyangiaceae bacterium]